MYHTFLVRYRLSFFRFWYAAVCPFSDFGTVPIFDVDSVPEDFRIGIVPVEFLVQFYVKNVPRYFGTFLTCIIGNEIKENLNSFATEHSNFGLRSFAVESRL